MPQGGTITIETVNVYLDEAYADLHVAVKPGWYAMLVVTDTGHGMNADTQKSIFEPFFTTKDQGKGTGLGLSTVYGIVKQSGGYIWVDSEVDVGTNLKIYLPLVDEEVTEAEVDAGRPETACGNETILLAEDEDMVRHLVRDSLKLHGYTVLEAANGEEALLICQRHEGPIHVLLTDVVMPRMGGKELAEQLTQSHPDMRVIYMSGYPDHSIAHHGILDRNISFIGKPFRPDAVVLRVAEVLQQDSGLARSLRE
jgi:CheY-like chemotaxis protein